MHDTRDQVLLLLSKSQSSDHDVQEALKAVAKFFMHSLDFSELHLGEDEFIEMARRAWKIESQG